MDIQSIFFALYETVLSVGFALLILWRYIRWHNKLNPFPHAKERATTGVAPTAQIAPPRGARVDPPGGP